MKKNLIIIFMALVTGAIFCWKIYSFVKIDENEDNLTVFQVGVYKNKINALSEAKKYGGIIHHDEDLYRVYVAAYKSQDVINKMKEFYNEEGINVYLKKIPANEDYLNLLNKYEKMINQSDDNSIYKDLNELLVKKLEANI